MFSKHACWSAECSNSLGPSSFFLMFWANIRRLERLSSSDEVYDDSISLNYILLSVTNNFGLGKWAKIERNDCKQLCVKTSLVDWSVYTWAQWVNKIARQNRMGFCYILSWSFQVWLLAPPFFSNVSTSSV